ncbi:MAG: hypothetical protein JWO59_1481 [Chloroflexi bacterium]|nr:hypothetical protein [Chloroflexota bacterium]
MSPKRLIARLTACALLLAGAPLLPRPALLPAIPAAHASPVTLAKATYYDKTLAGILISSIQVTNGQCTVGFYSKANGGDFMSVDSVQFYRTS